MLQVDVTGFLHRENLLAKEER